MLTGLVEEYTKPHLSANRANAAALVLRSGLRSERCGRTFRRKIYLWSTNRGTSDQLAAVIVAACRDEIFATHPDEALVRLHHVARRNGRCEAHQALVELVGTDRRLLRQMLRRIADRDPTWRTWALTAGSSSISLIRGLSPPLGQTTGRCSRTETCSGSWALAGTSSSPALNTRIGLLSRIAGWSAPRGKTNTGTCSSTYSYTAPAEHRDTRATVRDGAEAGSSVPPSALSFSRRSRLRRVPDSCDPPVIGRPEECHDRWTQHCSQPRRGRRVLAGLIGLAHWPAWAALVIAALAGGGWALTAVTPRGAAGSGRQDRAVIGGHC